MKAIFILLICGIYVSYCRAYYNEYHPGYYDEDHEYNSPASRDRSRGISNYASDSIGDQLNEGFDGLQKFISKVLKGGGDHLSLLSRQARDFLMELWKRFVEAKDDLIKGIKRVLGEHQAIEFKEKDPFYKFW